MEEEEEERDEDGGRAGSEGRGGGMGEIKRKLLSAFIGSFKTNHTKSQQSHTLTENLHVQIRSPFWSSCSSPQTISHSIPLSPQAAEEIQDDKDDDSLSNWRFNLRNKCSIRSVIMLWMFYSHPF